MMNSGKAYNFFRWLISLFTGDPVAKAGSAMIFTGAVLLGGFNYYVGGEAADTNTSSHSVAFAVWTDTGIVEMSIGVALIVLGVIVLLARQIHRIKNPSFLIYAKGMALMSEKPPFQALPKKDFDARDLSYKLDSYNRNEVMTTYGVMRYNFEHRVEHSKAERIYMATLGSFPFQFLFGALVRNAHAEVVLMDYDRNAGKWSVLKAYHEGDPLHHVVNNQPLDIDAEVARLCAANATDVGIALSYTFDIPLSQIPLHVRTSTVVLELSGSRGHDKTDSTEIQKKLLNDLSQMLNAFSKRGRTVHLFVAAQASFCVAMGKNYMDNAHGTLILYNYDHKSRSYPWSVRFEKGDVS